MPDLDAQSPNHRLTQRTAVAALGTVLALLWVLDVGSVAAASGLEGPLAWLRLLPGLLAALALLPPDARLPLTWRATCVAVVSGTVTLCYLVSVPPPFTGWGTLESLSLLLLLARTARETPRPWVAAGVCSALGAAVLAAPMRLETSRAILVSFLLTFAVGAAVGLGCYLRGLDERRRRAVADVRQSERLALARELHDFVAHHVTGIVVQAQAARTIREAAPEQVDQLLQGIEQAGSQTLESMRKLVRVLREDDSQAVRPGELFAELAQLVAAFAERDVPATLHVGEAARRAQPDPEVETSIRNVVREALTNVRRHAPGSSSVAVRVDLDHESDGDEPVFGRLRVEVYNAPGDRSLAGAEPRGGRGGLGLVGLTERAEAVGGTLQARRVEDGGWRLTAEFPVRDAVTGSAA